jgi:hypothetical protein
VLLLKRHVVAQIIVTAELPLMVESSDTVFKTRRIMSHFLTLVFGNNVEDQMAPYQEFESSDGNSIYVKDTDVTQEVLNHLKTFKDSKNSLDRALEYVGLHKSACISPSQTPDTNGKHMFGYAVVENNVLHKAVRRTNPDAKWDWYEVGGRWDGFLTLKGSGFGSNQAKKCEIDVSTMIEKKVNKAVSYYNLYSAVFEGKTIPCLDDIQEKDPYVARKLLLQDPLIDALQRRADEINDFLDVTKAKSIFCNGNLEEVINRASHKALVPFAFVSNGKWNDRGRMGWFGVVSGEKPSEEWHEQFMSQFNQLPDQELITVVDCHI